MNNNAKDTPKFLKKKKRIIIIASVVVLLLIVGAFSRQDKAPENEEESEQQTTGELLAESNSSEETESSEEESISEESVSSESSQAESIILIAGEQGEYGEMFTINADTEFEENYYIYRVPAGTYTVTLTGKYMDQFNVYGETVYVTEDGWEELSDVFYVKLFQPGESDTVTIEDGQIIEIHGNGIWELTLN